jgi:hypothetical protein
MIAGPGPGPGARRARARWTLPVSGGTSGSGPDPVFKFSATPQPVWTRPARAAPSPSLSHSRSRARAGLSACAWPATRWNTNYARCPLRRPIVRAKMRGAIQFAVFVWLIPAVCSYVHPLSSLSVFNVPRSEQAWANNPFRMSGKFESSSAYVVSFATSAVLIAGLILPADVSAGNYPPINTKDTTRCKVIS